MIGPFRQQDAKRVAGLVTSLSLASSEPTWAEIVAGYHDDLFAVIVDHINGLCDKTAAIDALYDITRAYSAAYPRAVEAPTRQNRWRWATDWDQIVADTRAALAG